MNKVKTIIWVAPEFYPTYTGHGIYLQKLAPFLEAKGFKFIVLTARCNNEPREEQIGNIKVVRLDCIRNNIISIFLYSLKSLKYLWQERESYTIIHIHGFFDRFGLFGFFSKFLNKSLIMQMVLIGVDDPESCVNSFKFKALRKSFFKMFDSIITISSPLTSACKNFGLSEKKIIQIPQGVDETIFNTSNFQREIDSVKEELNISKDHRIVIFVGAIIERKGVRELICAWEKVKANHSNISLILLGPSNFEGEAFNAFSDEMQMKAKQLSDIYFVGVVSDVERYLKASSLFVFPSKKEGFGNVIIEAMACRLACIVSEMDGVGYDTVVNNKTGYVIKNQQELENRINELLSDNEKMELFGLNGMQRVHEHFKLSKIAEVYERLYLDLLDK